MKATKQAKKRGRPFKAKVSEPLPVTEETNETITLDDNYVGSFLVVTLCPNKSWVGVRMDGEKVLVRCHANRSDKLLGKTIKVGIIKSPDAEDFYEHIL
jgi:hypothetical protein